MTPYQKNIVSFLVELNVLVWAGLAIYAFVWLPNQDQIMARWNTVAFRQTDTPPPRILPSATTIPTLSPTPRRISVPAQVPVQPPFVSSAAVQAPGGTSPTSPMMPGDSWRGLDPGARVWYRIGSGGVHMDVFLEANPLNGMSMDVYAPGNLDAPIGQGTLDNRTYRLGWAGGHWSSIGDWLARVTNGSSSVVQYKLISDIREIPKCESTSYWEYIGKNLVYWTRCK